jgi:nitroreductase
MELQNAIRNRYSVRNFTDKAVSRSEIEKILEWTSLAPSAVNFQPWHFIVISRKDKLETIRSVYHRQWLQTAPVIVVACVNHRESWKRGSDGHDFGEVDTSIAIDHLTLAATANGLGTCWICNFDVTRCKQILNLPEYLEPLALIPLGYPAGTSPAKNRKPLQEIVSWEEFQRKEYKTKNPE